MLLDKLIFFKFFIDLSCLYKLIFFKFLIKLLKCTIIFIIAKTTPLSTLLTRRYKGRGLGCSIIRKKKVTNV